MGLSARLFRGAEAPRLIPKAKGKGKGKEQAKAKDKKQVLQLWRRMTTRKQRQVRRQGQQQLRKQNAGVSPLRCSRWNCEQLRSRWRGF